MDRAEIQQNAGEVEQRRAAKRRGGKWRILPVAVLAVGAIAAVLYFRQQRLSEQMKLDEQMRALAEGPEAYGEDAQAAPRWYLKLAKKYKLPVQKRPFWFTSSKELRDGDMAVVGRVNTLRFVWLDGSDITDTGMSHLKGLTRLHFLSLRRTKIGDTGLAHLSELTELTILNLHGTKVGDAGLAHLKKLKKLKRLGLDNTQVTDVGLAHLKSLKGLADLNLSGTRVTPEAVADLKSALPNASIHGP